MIRIELIKMNRYIIPSQACWFHLTISQACSRKTNSLCYKELRLQLKALPGQKKTSLGGRKNWWGPYFVTFLSFSILFNVCQWLACCRSTAIAKVSNSVQQVTMESKEENCYSTVLENLLLLISHNYLKNAMFVHCIFSRLNNLQPQNSASKKKLHECCFTC